MMVVMWHGESGCVVGDMAWHLGVVSVVMMVLAHCGGGC